MSAQMVLLPVFVQVGLTFALLIGMALARRRSLVSGETKIRDVALGEPNWPKSTTQIARPKALSGSPPRLASKAEKPMPKSSASSSA